MANENDPESGYSVLGSLFRRPL